MHTTVTRKSDSRILFTKERSDQGTKPKKVSEFEWDLNLRFDLQAREILKTTRSEVLVGKESRRIFQSLKREFRKLGVTYRRRTWAKSISEWHSQSPTDTIAEIPASPGVYYFWGEKGELLYVGKSIKLRERVQSHFSSDMRLPVDRKIRKFCRSISYETTLDEFSALLLEANEVKTLNPAFNRALRSKRKPYGSIFTANSKGYYEAKSKFLRIDQEKELQEKHSQKTKKSDKDFPPFVIPFYSKLARENFLDKHVKDGTLCRTPGAGRACFYRQVDICKGACEFQEDAATYNNRLMGLFERLENSLAFQGHFVLISKNAHSKDGERFHSFVLFENSVYKGFGYLPSKDTKRPSVAALRDRLICEGVDTRDTRRLIAKSFKKKELRLVRLDSNT